MCPPRAVDVINEIGPFWTNESLFIFLGSVQNKSPGAPLPSDVFADINPYLYEPSNLPENVWYLVKPDCPKQSEFGFWRVKDDSRPIYSGSLVIGWRTTLEFYKDRSPNEDQTDWLMHEYSISLEGSSEPESAMMQGKRSLCRVFPADKKVEDSEIDQNRAHSDVIGRNNDEDGEKKQVDVYQKTDQSVENGDTGGRDDPPHDEGNEGSESDIGNQLARFLEGEDLRIDEHLANDDYFELADLLDPLSSSSSSENSSCVSLCSDVCFDSVALLNELEAKVEEAFQTKPSAYNCEVSRTIETAGSVAPEGISTAASVAPEGISTAVSVAPRGTSSGNNAIKTAELAEAETRSVEVSCHEKRHHEGDDPPENAKKRPPPASDDAEASTSRQRPGADDGKKGDRGKTIIKKFFCFLAF